MPSTDEWRGRTRRNSASFCLYVGGWAAVVVEGASAHTRALEPPPCSPSGFFSILLVSAYLLADRCASGLCAALFVAINIGLMAFNSGAGIVGALLVGTVCAVLTLAAGQLAITLSRHVALRLAIAAVFVVPAAVAGYHVVFALSQIGAPSLAWREVFAWLGAVCIGSSTFTRLTLISKTRPIEPERTGGEPSRPVLTAAANEG
ncbi:MULTISPECIES: hypothetical protein [Bradyrhizobium]|uniref:hypothetical protein n=1 Tax=Bradyrhizobium TaxID=374 RepID=UPI0027E532FC|nr:hypothetical protein [Bradyrhizobium guangdongense]